MATVADVMSREVHTVPPGTLVADAAAVMVKARIGSVMVLNGSWLVGILTERDVLRAAAAGADLSATPVSAFMTEDPVTADPAMDADKATEVMAAQGFRHLPVLDGDTVVGMVSLRDLLSSRIRRPSP